jgi:tRNA dimethylallyltransferase
MSGPDAVEDRSDQRPRALCLMGPTAAGKTAIAVALAERHGFAAISVDSALVYRGMDVGTAKPDAATLARVPHALVDIREPGQAYSAAEFRTDALREMAQAHAAGRIPLLVGGTGLYFRALTRGLSALPGADPEVRAAIEGEASRHGWAVLHRQLATADPVAASRIHPNDPQRIQRALEVLALTGQPISARQHGGGARPPWRFLRIVLSPAKRALLHERVVRRFHAMLEAGFVDEVRRLRERPGLHPDLPAIRAVGYRQVWGYLEGDYGLDEAISRGVHATRQLAKRQLTWLRSERDAIWVDPLAVDGLGRVSRLVADFLGR